MSNISLRARWNEAYPDLKLADGIVRGGLAGAYTRAPAWPAVEAFPHRSLRRLLSAARWPRGDLVKVSDNPIAAEDAWTNELNGLQFDDEYWYAVTMTNLFRIPRSVPLQEAKGSLVQAAAVPPDWPHGGGASLFQGYLYVAVTGEGKRPLPTGEVWVMRTSDLLRVDRIPVPETGPGIDIDDPRMVGMPFLAIHPRKPLLYSLNFDTSLLRVYRLFPHPGPPGPDGSRLHFLAAVTLTDEAGNYAQLGGIQNAVITPNEHLLLMCDVEDERRGIHLFDLLSGRRRWHRDIGVRTTEYRATFHVLGFTWTLHAKGWEAEFLFVKDMGRDGFIHIGNLALLPQIVDARRARARRSDVVLSRQRSHFV